MRILLAPDKFKGTLTASEVCAAITEGIHRVDASIEVLAHPLADGGEGTADLLESALGLQREVLTVNDPLFRPIETYYLRNEAVAFIEMAHASGLQLLAAEERHALNTTTYGTGELMKHALDSGVSEIYLMIGGSSTSDGGTGMALALGYDFELAEAAYAKGTGGSLNSISAIDNTRRHARIDEVKFTVLCDVQNPLYGPNGAAFVYGPQKGANSDEVKQLDDGLRNLAAVSANELEQTPGAGAAGGLGYGAMSFLGADLKSGIASVMEITGFDEKLDGVDLIVTGEGKMDLQTVEGKVIAGVSTSARAHHIPFAVICGMAEEKERVQQQIQAWGIYPLVNENTSPEAAMANSYELVRERAQALIEAFLH